jgi:hypothetical protein
MEQTVSINGWCRISSTSRNIYDLNELAISSPYESVFLDLQEIVLKGKTLDDYFDIVSATAGACYKGFDKLIYVNVIKALQIIIESKKKCIRKCIKLNNAIAFLHQDVKLSPNTIQNLLSLFDIKLNTAYILKASYKVFSEKPQPKWLQNIEIANPH